MSLMSWLVSIKAEPAFPVTGFTNWKKATSSFKEYDCSIAHRDAVAFEISTKSPPVTELLKSEVDTVHVSWKSSLINQLSALHYLLQCISIKMTMLVAQT